MARREPSIKKTKKGEEKNSVYSYIPLFVSKKKKEKAAKSSGNASGFPYVFVVF